MRFQLISDVHAEFHRDDGMEFFQSVQPNDAQVLVIAGDLSLPEQMEDCLKAACAKWSHVVYVLGNHEYYHHSSREVWNTIRRLEAKLPNLHVLENGVVVIEGQRFIGATLWFPDLPRSRQYRPYLNDYGVIREFMSWWVETNQKSMSFLRHNIREGDVVVTHHVPLPTGVSPHWRADPTTDFFVCDMTETIWVCKPKIWCYGHTHDPHDFVFASTRLICNPFGYLGRGENAGFDWGKVIDI